jgi:hypothetical protein
MAFALAAATTAQILSRANTLCFQSVLEFWPRAKPQKKGDFASIMAVHNV